MTMREPKSKTPFGIQSSTSRNAISSHFTIPKSYFINYTIPFYNTPNIPKFYFFPILFKYSIFFNISLSLSLSLSFPFRLSPSTSGTRTDRKKKPLITYFFTSARHFFLSRWSNRMRYSIVSGDRRRCSSSAEAEVELVLPSVAVVEVEDRVDSAVVVDSSVVAVVSVTVTVWLWWRWRK